MLWLVDVAWMTPQICLLGLLRCSSLAIREHCFMAGWNVRGLREVPKRRSQKEGKQQHPKGPTPESWWQMQNRHLYFTSLGKASVSWLIYVRRIWFNPSPEGGRAHSGAVALAPNLWVWNKKVTCSSLLLRQGFFISPHHIHPAGQVGKWILCRWECFN